DAGQCVGGKVNGTRALAYAIRSAVDPDAAAARGLLDRRGSRSAKRNDGKTNAQVTPLYLLTSALSSMDAAFETYAQKNPNDAQLASSINGPMFARGVDLLDTIRRDDAARLELERLIMYLLDSKSGSDALQSLLVSSTDSAQILQDEENLVPVFHAMAKALAP